MYNFKDFTLTKREVLFSIIIFCLSLCLGLIINNLIDNIFTQKEEIFNKALKINDNDVQFKYALDTSVGNLINYGKFESIDEVKDDWLIKSYLAYEKVTEEYTRHYRTVCSQCGKSTCCHTETYYTWDIINSTKEMASKIKYSGVEFYSSKFTGYPWSRLEIRGNVKNDVGKISNNYIYKSNHLFNSVGDLRYYYEIIPKSFYGTTFGTARDNNFISYNNSNNEIEIANTSLNNYLENKKANKGIAKVIFWIIYICVISFGIYYFIYCENDWLED